ncbi:MAG: alpha/beta hydrolase [Hylemonella sp.]
MQHERNLRSAWLTAALVFLTMALAQAQPCGELVTIDTHEGTRTRYAFAHPASPAQGSRVALVLLPGGGGHLRLDEQACPQALKGNSLVRSLPLFQAAGFATALVDARSDHTGEDGLAGFRASATHAQDLGRIIADVRRRTQARVWLVGTSRGAISAANAASRLSGPAAPDGLVLTSPVTSGNPTGSKPWVAQTVFDLPLESIRMPVLVIGHAQDKCLRSPATLNERIMARTEGVREQLVRVDGGPGRAGLSAVEACEGRSPHGFLEQEAEVAAGIVRFINGARY